MNQYSDPDMEINGEADKLNNIMCINNLIIEQGEDSPISLNKPLELSLNH